MRAVRTKQRMGKQVELELSQNWHGSRTNEVISSASVSIVLPWNPTDGMPRWYGGDKDGGVHIRWHGGFGWYEGDKDQDCKQLISS